MPLLKNLSPEESIILDVPYAFGSDCNWLAIPTADTERLAEFLKMKEIVACNWKHGVIWGHHLKVYVSPPVEGWTFVISCNLPYVDGEKGIKAAKNMLIELSLEYGQAHYFGLLDSGSDYAHFFKAEDGQIVRAYGYVEGQNIIVEGPPTPAEEKYNLVDTFSEESRNDPDYLLREEIDFPHPAVIWEIAGAWGLNPQELPKVMATRLGLLGERKW